MTNEKKALRWVLPLLAVALPLNLIFGVWKFSETNTQADVQLRKFNAVVETIRERYVDGSENRIGYSKLVDGALEGMLQNLDKHSHYLDKDAYSSAQERMAGQFAGIGITYTERDGVFMVRNVIPGGPAAKAGLKPNDRIRFVNGNDLADKNSKQASKLFKGDKGTPITLGIFRTGENRDLEVELIRDLIKMPTVNGIRKFSNGILYLQITQFNNRTESELKNALVANADATGLIMDLRHNPGGLLASAQKVCSFFLSPFDEKGDRRIVVSVMPRNVADEKIRPVIPEGIKLLKLPIVILVNGQSASASEIVAGCLKDYGRAKLVGTKTFGKGSVQEERSLGDGTAIRITIAKYYTPSKVVIHELGIEPDVTIPMTREQELAALIQIGTDKPLDEMTTHDPQLAEAVKILDSEGK